MRSHLQNRQCGVTLLEVLVTIIILAFGLLGLAGLQGKIQMTEMESYQRSQAIILLQDMADRMYATASITNPNTTADYASGDTAYGTGRDAEDCTTMAAGISKDICEWNLALLGATEVSGESKIGAMVGARGCITQTQVGNATKGVCTPAVYRVDVAWQGMSSTAVPNVDCGEDQYGDETKRRVVSLMVTIGTPKCASS